MRTNRLVLTYAALLLAIGVATIAQAAGPTMLRAGEADGANAVFVFDENAKPPAIVLRTARIGVAGSRIDVRVDQTKKPVFSHIFVSGECKFGDGGSACEVTIPVKDTSYAAILARFKNGRVVRVTIRDAGVMKMDETASLSEFNKAPH
jgi:hypothetical protein